MGIIKFIFVISLMSIFLCGQTVLSEGFDYLKQVKKYVKCEAVLNVTANVLSASEEEFYQHEAHHASIDSRIIALEFARVGGHSVEEVDELFYLYLTEYRNVLQEKEANDELESFISSLRPLSEDCEELNAMQEDIIARRKEEIDYPK